MIRIYNTESMEGNEGEFRKRIVLPYFLVVLVTECNFDLSSGLPETRENWQLCQIVQQKSLLPLHYGRNFQVLSRNYFIFTNELKPEIREQMPGPKI